MMADIPPGAHMDTQEGELSSLSNVVTEGSMPASGSHTDLKAPSSPGLGDSSQMQDAISMNNTRNDINVDPFIDLSPMKGMGYSSFMPFSNMMSPPRTVYMPSFLDKQPPPLPPSGTSYHGNMMVSISNSVPPPPSNLTQQRIITGNHQQHTHTNSNTNGDTGHHHEDTTPSRKRMYEFDSMTNFHVSPTNNVINVGQSNMSSISSINSRINNLGNQHMAPPNATSNGDPNIAINTIDMGNAGLPIDMSDINMNSGMNGMNFVTSSSFPIADMPQPPPIQSPIPPIPLPTTTLPPPPAAAPPPLPPAITNANSINPPVHLVKPPIAATAKPVYAVPSAMNPRPSTMHAPPKTTATTTPHAPIQYIPSPSHAPSPSPSAPPHTTTHALASSTHANGGPAAPVATTTTTANSHSSATLPPPSMNSNSHPPPPLSSSATPAAPHAHPNPASNSTTINSTPTPQDGAPPAAKRKQCHCKNSKCLKLYCECFANRVYCSGCSCYGCHNTASQEPLVQKAVALTLERNPSAFKPKGQANSSQSNATNPKGCHCRKSGCLKKYCECFQAGIQCGPHCKCFDCKNNSNPPHATSANSSISNATSAAPAVKRPRRSSSSSNPSPISSNPSPQPHAAVQPHPPQPHQQHAPIQPHPQHPHPHPHPHPPQQPQQGQQNSFQQANLQNNLQTTHTQPLQQPHQHIQHLPHQQHQISQQLVPSAVGPDLIQLKIEPLSSPPDQPSSSSSSYPFSTTSTTSSAPSTTNNGMDAHADADTDADADAYTRLAQAADYHAKHFPKAVSQQLPHAHDATPPKLSHTRPPTPPSSATPITQAAHLLLCDEEVPMDGGEREGEGEGEGGRGGGGGGGVCPANLEKMVLGLLSGTLKAMVSAVD